MTAPTLYPLKLEKISDDLFDKLELYEYTPADRIQGLLNSGYLLEHSSIVIPASRPFSISPLFPSFFPAASSGKETRIDI